MKTVKLRYRYDTETGLYYLQSRYYNPTWGRFINADALIGQTGELLGHNMFAYTKNNPVNFKDDSGFVSSHVSYDIGEGTYGDGFEISSPPPYVSEVVDIITGYTSHYNYKSNVYFEKSGTYIGGTTEIKLHPSSYTETVRPLESASNIVSNVAFYAFLSWDMGNIWTANNGLSNGQRAGRTVLKAGATIAGYFAGIGISKLFALAAASSGPAGLLLLGAASGAVIMSSVVISAAENYGNNYFKNGWE
ncbi:RHS repeat-associated core domain-containing protein [Clostridium sp.]|uniref:RHS repeat-associated core domain-containing protein n=1 Tax=Clostridium sp. TaxID=1506 RepID=UPI002FC9B8C8